MNVPGSAATGDERSTRVAQVALAARLGLGTSTLMGRLSARASMLALDTAFEHGITHFDTARMYGYGEAEALLGRFIRTKRDAVTITTKAGIVPPRRSLGLSMLRTVARGAVAVAPGLRRTLRRQAEKSVRSGCFDAAAIRASLETSLRELATDRIDYFLLHECEPEQLSPELLDVLQAAVAAGKIGRFGIATTAQASCRILAELPMFADVVQLPNSLTYPAGPIVDSAGTAISHSIFRGEIERVEATLVRAGYGSAALPAASLVRRAMLEFALFSNARGITLFASANPAHIAENALAARDRLFAPDVLMRLAADVSLVGEQT